MARARAGEATGTSGVLEKIKPAGAGFIARLKS
jgi:hypothetical protein